MVEGLEILGSGLNLINSDTYRFEAVKEIIIESQMYEIWAAQDAVVIEALTMLLKDKYNVTGWCDSYHLKGRGGVKAAVNKVLRATKEYKYFYRSDIKKYHASYHSIEGVLMFFRIFQENGRCGTKVPPLTLKHDQG